MRPAVLTVLLAALSFSAAAAAAAYDYSRMQQILAEAEAASKGNHAHYLDGRPEQALDALRSVEKPGEWESAFVLGNMVWRLHPDESLAWHRKAVRLSQGHSLAELEMALEYTRHDQCADAVASWARVDAGAELRGVLPAVAAYCHFKLEQYEQAYGLLGRTEMKRAGQLESVLDGIWGQRPAIARHADLVADLRAGREVDVEALLGATTALAAARGERPAGLLAVLDAIGERPVTGDLADLRCLRPVLVAERDEAREDDGYGEEDPERLQRLAAVWRKGLDRCGLLLPEGRLPHGKSLAGFLLSRVFSLGLLDAGEALAVHGPALQARADSAAGDLAALEVLASLQLLARDRKALAASDELGWQRYRNARFAASRVIGLISDGGEPSGEMAGMARRAWSDFPEDAQVLWMALEFGRLEGDDRKRALRSQVLAEYRGLTAYSELHVRKSAARLVRALAEYRALVLPEPAQP